jgi:hypothetical protein
MALMSKDIADTSKDPTDPAQIVLVVYSDYL